MSMETSMIHGYGFSTAEANDNALLEYISKNRHLLSKKENEYYDTIFNAATNKGISLQSDGFWTAAGKIVEETKAYNMVNYLYFRDCLLDSVANIMKKETGIEFEYQSGQEDCIGEGGTIMLSQAMPWEYRKAEILLNRDNFIGICKKYTKKIGIPDVSVEAVTVEYYG